MSNFVQILFPRILIINGKALFSFQMLLPPTNTSVQLRKVQSPLALRRLQSAIIEHVAELNRRLPARLAVREDQSSFEVYELEKPDPVLRVGLTGENHIRYTQLMKRHNEMQSGVIYVRASRDGSPTILFSDFPSPNVVVSYQEASNRLLDSSF